MSTLSSSEWHELIIVTSATVPLCDTMNTFIALYTWRPVRTAVFISSRSREIGRMDCVSSFMIWKRAMTLCRRPSGPPFGAIISPE